MNALLNRSAKTDPTFSTTTMSFVRSKLINGVRYYSLVESKRSQGCKYPKQITLQHLGRYDQAVQILQKMAIATALKQQHLIKLAQEEGHVNPVTAPLPDKTYRCIVIDPPWLYRLRKDDTTHRNRIPYQPMTIDEILKLPISDLGDRQGCILWLWFTNNHMVDASKCLEQWGFELKTILTWEKVTKAGTPHLGTGHWLRNCSEHCALATKGKVHALGNTNAIARKTPTILHAPRREHSRKPDEFYELVEKLCPDSKLELFARQQRQGWDCWGNETNLFV